MGRPYRCWEGLPRQFQTYTLWEMLQFKKIRESLRTGARSGVFPAEGPLGPTTTRRRGMQNRISRGRLDTMLIGLVMAILAGCGQQHEMDPAVHQTVGQVVAGGSAAGVATNTTGVASTKSTKVEAPVEAPVCSFTSRLVSSLAIYDPKLLQGLLLSIAYKHYLVVKGETFKTVIPVTAPLKEVRAFCNPYTDRVELIAVSESNELHHLTSTSNFTSLTGLAIHKLDFSGRWPVVAYNPLQKRLELYAADGYNKLLLARYDSTKAGAPWSLIGTKGTSGMVYGHVFVVHSSAGTRVFSHSFFMELTRFSVGPQINTFERIKSIKIASAPVAANTKATFLFARSVSQDGKSNQLVTIDDLYQGTPTIRGLGDSIRFRGNDKPECGWKKTCVKWYIKKVVVGSGLVKIIKKCVKYQMVHATCWDKLGSMAGTPAVAWNHTTGKPRAYWFNHLEQRIFTTVEMYWKTPAQPTYVMAMPEGVPVESPVAYWHPGKGQVIVVGLFESGGSTRIKQMVGGDEYVKQGSDDIDGPADYLTPADSVTVEELKLNLPLSRDPLQKF